MRPLLHLPAKIRLTCAWLCRLEGHLAPVLALCFMEYSGYVLVATAGEDRTIKVRGCYAAATLDAAVYVMAGFTPSLHALPACQSCHELPTYLQIWDLRNSMVVHESAVLGAHPLTSLAYDAGFRRLAAGDAAGVVRLFDASALPACRLTQVRGGLCVGGCRPARVDYCVAIAASTGLLQAQTPHFELVCCVAAAPQTLDCSRELGRAADALALEERARAADRAAASRARTICAQPAWQQQLQRQSEQLAGTASAAARCGSAADSGSTCIQALQFLAHPGAHGLQAAAGGLLEEMPRLAACSSAGIVVADVALAAASAFLFEQPGAAGGSSSTCSNSRGGFAGAGTVAVVQEMGVAAGAVCLSAVADSGGPVCVAAELSGSHLVAIELTSAGDGVPSCLANQAAAATAGQARMRQPGASDCESLPAHEQEQCYDLLAAMEGLARTSDLASGSAQLSGGDQSYTGTACVSVFQPVEPLPKGPPLLEPQAPARASPGRQRVLRSVKGEGGSSNSGGRACSSGREQPARAPSSVAGGSRHAAAARFNVDTGDHSDLDGGEDTADAGAVHRATWGKPAQGGPDSDAPSQRSLLASGPSPAATRPAPRSSAPAAKQHSASGSVARSATRPKPAPRAPAVKSSGYGFLQPKMTLGQSKPAPIKVCELASARL